MKWSGIENGALLTLAAGAGFEAFLSKDENLRCQQNLVNLPLAVVVLNTMTNRIDDILPLVPKLLSVLASLPPRQVTEVSGD